MMRHPSQDTLLKLALGVLDPAQERRVRVHLQDCHTCRDTLEEIGASIRLIGELEPNVRANLPALPEIPPLQAPPPEGPAGNLVKSRAGSLPPRFSDPFYWIRLAAMVAAGFGLGLLASENLRPPAVTVVPQQFVPRPPATGERGFVVCEGNDILSHSR
jgi:anti-sigma factor RsiW